MPRALRAMTSKPKQRAANQWRPDTFYKRRHLGGFARWFGKLSEGQAVTSGEPVSG